MDKQWIKQKKAWNNMHINQIVTEIETSCCLNAAILSTLMKSNSLSYQHECGITIVLATVEPCLLLGDWGEGPDNEGAERGLWARTAGGQSTHPAARLSHAGQF